MADQKLSQLASIIAANVANEDIVYLVDVSAGVDGSKSVTIQELKNVILTSGSATDAIVGPRTADDTEASPANTGTLTQLFSWFAGRIKAITGKASWLTAPAISLEDANTAIASKLNSSSYTASDVLNKLLTVDGATSGIDADLLDGQHGSFYAPINNAGLTGIPTAPTAALNTNTTQLANCVFVINQIAALVDSSPAALDTLIELATALGNDPNFATTITNALALKAPLANPTFTGTVGGITAGMVGLSNLTNHLQVNTTTDQIVGGNKTFSSIIIIPNFSYGFNIAPSTDTYNTCRFTASDASYWDFGVAPVSGGKAFYISSGSAGGGITGFQINSNNYNLSTSGVFSVTNSTASTSTTTGALVVGGGMGIAGNIYAGGNIIVFANLPTSASGLPTGALWKNGNVVNVV